MAHKDPEDCWRIGLYSSIAGHVALVIFSVFGLFSDYGPLPEPVIYSVSVEPGKALGGKSQVAKDDKPSPIAPVKNVTASEQKQEKTDDKPEEQKPAEDAEVSVADKKPTPKPTAPAKVTPKATAKPATSQKDAKETKKSDGDEVDKRLQAALQRYLGESTDAGGKGFGAGRVGGAGMGGGEVRPPEFFKYRDLLLGRIKEAWRWGNTSAALITQISFDLQADGTAKNVRVVKSSGDSGFDDSVVRAVIKASPFPPPPTSVYEKYFKSVRTTFDPRE